MKNTQWLTIVININMEIQFDEKVGHRGWLIGLKLFLTRSLPGLHIF